jgi:hypothetical protein
MSRRNSTRTLLESEWYEYEWYERIESRSNIYRQKLCTVLERVNEVSSFSSEVAEYIGDNKVKLASKILEKLSSIAVQRFCN